MTDGIIAFDMKGNIIYNNPAAVELLQLNEGENTFNSIFENFKTDINLEKIVYLENWTSSEQRINIGENILIFYLLHFKMRMINLMEL